MTALTEYQRLESSAVWRASPEDRRRDVFVSVGDATLVIYDNAGSALAHWSLPAIIRVNPTDMPALYCAGADAPEELEIADEFLVEAIERVRTAIARRRPRQGRLRLVLLGGGLVAVVWLAVFWLPDALIRHAAQVVPSVKRIELGNRLLDNIRRVAGAPCETANGRSALDRLYTRLLGDLAGRIIVLSSGIAQSGHLPGGLILVNRTLVEDFDDPAVVAGHILAEDLRALIADPVQDMLIDAGPMTAFRLLTTGDVPDQVLTTYAESLMSSTPLAIPDEYLLQAFAAAKIPATPYAYALDISGETTLTLIEADPVLNDPARPVLPDGAWVSLQGICGE